MHLIQSAKVNIPLSSSRPLTSPGCTRALHNWLSLLPLPLQMHLKPTLNGDVERSCASHHPRSPLLRLLCYHCRCRWLNQSVESWANGVRRELVWKGRKHIFLSIVTASKLRKYNVLERIKTNRTTNAENSKCWFSCSNRNLDEQLVKSIMYFPKNYSQIANV